MKRYFSPRAAALPLVAAFFALAFAVPASAQLIVDFPDVEGWYRGDVREYPRPELGYSVSYTADDGGAVSFFVYDFGVKDIPAGHDNEVVKAELDRVSAELDTAVKMGLVEDVKYGEIDVIDLGSGLKARRKLASMTMRGVKLTAEVYVFGHESHFIKIRVTRPFVKEGKITDELKTLFASVAKSISTSTLKEKEADAGTIGAR